MKYHPLKIVIGTKVRILNPVFVQRVGYENNYQEVKEQVVDAIEQMTWGGGQPGEMYKVFEVLDGVIKNILSQEELAKQQLPVKIGELEFKIECSNKYQVNRERITKKLAEVIAYQIVGIRMGSANQNRKMFTEEIPEQRGNVRTVNNILHKKIGTRHIGYSCDDYDYEPTFLENEQTVKLLSLSSHSSVASSIEAKNVEVVLEILNEYKEFTSWYEKNPSSLSLKQQMDAIMSMRNHTPSEGKGNEEEKNSQSNCISRCITVLIKNLEEANWTSPPFEERIRTSVFDNDDNTTRRDCLIDHFGHHFSSKVILKVLPLCNEEQREHLFKEVLWDSEFIFHHFDIFSVEEKEAIKKEVFIESSKMRICGDRRMLSSFLDFETYINERAW